MSRGVEHYVAGVGYHWEVPTREELVHVFFTFVNIIMKLPPRDTGPDMCPFTTVRWQRRHSGPAPDFPSISHKTTHLTQYLLTQTPSPIHALNHSLQLLHTPPHVHHPCATPSQRLLTQPPVSCELSEADRAAANSDDWAQGWRHWNDGGCDHSRFGVSLWAWLHAVFNKIW